MEQTDKEPPAGGAFVALSGPGQLEVHHGRLRDRDPARGVLASTLSPLDLQVVYQGGRFH